MANYCKEREIYCEVATDLGFCSVTGCIKRNQVSNINTEHNEVYETIKRGLEDAVNGRVRVTGHSVSCWTDAPMVEYAPVVRCRDCKWFAEFTSNGKTMGFGSCNNPQNIMSKCPRTDWFCGDGKDDE